MDGVVKPTGQKQVKERRAAAPYAEVDETIYDARRDKPPIPIPIDLEVAKQLIPAFTFTVLFSFFFAFGLVLAQFVRKLYM